MWMIVYLLKIIYHLLLQQKVNYQKGLTWPIMAHLDIVLVHKLVYRHCKNVGIFLFQEKYIDDVLKNLNVSLCKHVSTPMKMGKLFKDMTFESIVEKDVRWQQFLIQM